LHFFFIVGFLIEAGHWYRFIMYGSAFVLMFITRYIGVELFIKAFTGITPQQKIANKKKDL
jgi:3-methyladenine DNA glycosylase Mpg